MRRAFLKFPVLGLTVFLAASAVCGEREHEQHLCPKNRVEFKAIQRKAQANNPEAQTILSSCYDLGRNVEPSRKENIRWLTQAAAQGYAPAEYELGHIYLYGSGVPADYQQALVWEKKAAQQGAAKAQHDLAFMYERGLGVEANATQAALWNRKAAEQGEREAQLDLAKFLEAQDRAEALRWYRQAARQNMREAQFRLAQMYLEKPNHNCKTALFWHTRAAENGEAAAMYELGKLYQSGECIPRNTGTAYTWFQTGARFGSQESRTEAEKLSSLLTDAQRKAIDLKIEKWISKHSGADQQEDAEEKEER
jgi:hypothetical protein